MRAAIPNDWRSDLNIENIGILKYVEDGMDEAFAASINCRATTAWHDLTGRVVLQGREWLANIRRRRLGRRYTPARQSLRQVRVSRHRSDY